VIFIRSLYIYSVTQVDQGAKRVNEEELDPPVQGPINREPEEKLFPDRRTNKDSGIRRL